MPQAKNRWAENHGSAPVLAPSRIEHAAGKYADFIVLNANPLEDIANTRKIDKVYLRGQEVDRAALRARWQARWKTAGS